MNKLNLSTLCILLFLSISSISCKKNTTKSSSKYVGIATTYKSEIRRENGAEYHFMAHDTMDFEVTVIVEGKTIQFFSTNDSIVESRTFNVKDSAANNNTYASYQPDKRSIERLYCLKNDSFIYSYNYYVTGTINSYRVRFAGIKQ